MNALPRGAMFMTVMVCSAVLPCAAITIQASTIVSEPVPALSLYSQGAYAQSDRKTNATKLILIPNGDNPGVIGCVNLVATTNKGSFNATLPLCQDKDQFECWANREYFVSVPAFDGRSVTGGNNPIVTGISVAGELQNISEKSVSMMLKILKTDDNYSGASNSTDTTFSTVGIVTLPAASVCSLDVNTEPDFGELTEGKTATSIQVTSNASGSGYVTFETNDNDGTYGLIKNRNGGALSYSVVDISTSLPVSNVASGHWQGDLTRDYGLQLQSVPVGTTPGEYSGTMTTTLSCE